ncbi:peptidoglycan-binding protein [Sphingomonas sp. HITSZ_GF]|uniref:L,D-transpeptidase n=1 Tax=Sphingomonas sp. HITSZ_GF TaxID=3037247 RepID=UPI00240E44D1|nr:peptidoglycan-binding protein [Sphingomonas sp. HITSZ_GF]MDG2534488.1 peptidoglycan-binding protein [Sphingomonas sp. HITSZ_GF]
MAKSIHVSMPDFTITVSQDGAPVREITHCGFGRQAGHNNLTPTLAGGRLSARRDADHVSGSYPPPHGGAPMPYSLFLAEFPAVAFHQGDPLAESHGCIHLARDDAKWLFEWAGDDPVAVDIVGPHPLPGVRPAVYMLGARNMRAATLAQIRAALAALGLLPAAGEPVFDEALDAAIRAYQGQHGLDPDGKVGPATAASLGVQL